MHETAERIILIPGYLPDKPQHIMYGNRKKHPLPRFTVADKPQHIMYGNYIGCFFFCHFVHDKPQHIMYGNSCRLCNDLAEHMINLNI